MGHLDKMEILNPVIVTVSYAAINRKLGIIHVGTSHGHGVGYAVLPHFQTLAVWEQMRSLHH